MLSDKMFVNSSQPTFCPTMPLQLQTSKTPVNSLFPPMPSAADQLKLLQELQLFNLARFGTFQQKENQSHRKDKERPEDEIELRVGARILTLRKSEDEGSKRAIFYIQQAFPSSCKSSSKWGDWRCSCLQYFHAERLGLSRSNLQWRRLFACQSSTRGNCWNLNV